VGSSPTPGIFQYKNNVIFELRKHKLAENDLNLFALRICPQ